MPYEVAGNSTATVQLHAYGAASQSWTLPVAPAAPGIFTLGSSGVGRGAVLNQDNSVNAPGNYAPAGTIVQIFATGGGQTSPPGITGSVTATSGGGSSSLRVKVLEVTTR